MVRLFAYGNPLPKYVLWRGDGTGNGTRPVTFSIYCEPGQAIFLTASVPPLPGRRLEGIMYQFTILPPVDPVACLQAMEMLSFLPRLHEESWAAAWAIATGYLVPKSSPLWLLHNGMKRWLKEHGHYEPILAGRQLQSRLDSLVGALIEHGVEIDTFCLQQGVMNHTVGASSMLRRCGIRTYKEHQGEECRRDALLAPYYEYFPEVRLNKDVGKVVRNRMRWEWETLLEYASYAIEEGIEDPVQVIGYGHYGLCMRKAHRYAPVTCSGGGMYEDPQWRRAIMSPRLAWMAYDLATKRLATHQQLNSRGGYRYRIDKRVRAQVEGPIGDVVARLGY